MLKPNLYDLPEIFRDFYQQDNLVGASGQLHGLGSGSGSTLNNLLIINSLFHDRIPLRTLEIGFCHGVSGLLLLSLHELYDKGGTHHAIDPFQSTAWDSVGKLQVNHWNLDNRFTLYEDFSCHVLSKLCLEKKKYDLIYIDGSHLFEDVFVDLYYSLRLLEDGGVVLFDDSTDPHVAKVLTFIESNYDEFLKPLDLVKYRGNRIFDKIKYKAAAKLKFSQLTGYEKQSDKYLRDWRVKLERF